MNKTTKYCFNEMQKGDLVLHLSRLMWSFGRSAVSVFVTGRIAARGHEAWVCVHVETKKTVESVQISELDMVFFRYTESNITISKLQCQAMCES